jgi:hypothetical protein
MPKENDYVWLVHDAMHGLGKVIRKINEHQAEFMFLGGGSVFIVDISSLTPALTDDQLRAWMERARLKAHEIGPRCDLWLLIHAADYHQCGRAGNASIPDRYQLEQRVRDSGVSVD